MSKHLTETIPLKAVVFNESGVPVTTATIKVQVIRDSDGNYWTGSAWSAVKTDLTVAHVGAGVYVYSLDTSHASFLSPSSITCFFWSSDTELEDAIGINFDLDEDYEARVQVNDLQARVPAALTGSGNIKASVEEKNAAIGLTAQEKLDVNTEVDNGLDTPIPGSPTADSVNERIKSMDDRLPNDPADQSLVEAKIDAAVDILDGADDRDHTEIFDAVAAIQNNTRLKTAVPAYMQKPDSGNRAFRWSANLYDNTGAPEDPDDAEILVRVLQDDGTPITANLFKENALTNPLDNPTDTGNFPPASGWRAMEKLAVGQFDLFYKVASTETEEHLNIEFGWMENSVGPIIFPVSTIVSDVKGDIEDIQAKMDAVYAKTDAGTPSPTIPAQITTHDTDIKALPNVKATPEFLIVPAGRTSINQEGGITDVATTIPILDSAQLEDEGVVLIESEYVIYTSIVNNVLTGCTRGAYGTSNVAHADVIAVYKTLVYPIRLMIFDNQGNMVAPDSAPTIEIDDWNGNQEVAPVAMTLISVGLYGYNYVVPATARPEPKTLNFVVVENSITTNRQNTLMLLDEPASQVYIQQVIGGGTGEFLVDQDGWWDSDGILQPWTDSMVGFLKDAETGDRLDNVLVTAFSVIAGKTIVSVIPPGQVVADVNGNWKMRLDKGTYEFLFWKSQYRFPTPEVEREVDP